MSGVRPSTVTPRRATSGPSSGCADACSSSSASSRGPVPVRARGGGAAGSVVRPHTEGAREWVRVPSLQRQHWCGPRTLHALQRVGGGATGHCIGRVAGVREEAPRQVHVGGVLELGSVPAAAALLALVLLDALVACERSGGRAAASRRPAPPPCPPTHARRLPTRPPRHPLSLVRATPCARTAIDSRPRPVARVVASRTCRAPRQATDHHQHHHQGDRGRTHRG